MYIHIHTYPRDCCYKLLQNWRLRTTESYSLTILEPKICQGPVVSGDSVGEFISCLSF